MPQIVFLADGDGNATYYNQRWFEYTGLDTEHVSGQEWHAIVHPDELPETIVRFENPPGGSHSLAIPLAVKAAGAAGVVGRANVLLAEGGWASEFMEAAQKG